MLRVHSFFRHCAQWRSHPHSMVPASFGCMATHIVVLWGQGVKHRCSVDRLAVVAAHQHLDEALGLALHLLVGPVEFIQPVNVAGHAVIVLLACGEQVRRVAAAGRMEGHMALVGIDDGDGRTPPQVEIFRAQPRVPSSAAVLPASRRPLSVPAYSDTKPTPRCHMVSSQSVTRHLAGTVSGVKTSSAPKRSAEAQRILPGLGSRVHGNDAAGALQLQERQYAQAHIAGAHHGYTPAFSVRSLLATLTRQDSGSATASSSLRFSGTCTKFSAWHRQYWA